MSLTHTFAGNPLDRADTLRRDPDALQTAQDAPASRFLLLKNLRVSVRDMHVSGHEKALALAWIEQERARPMLDGCPEPVLLGLNGSVAHFAVDVSDMADAESALPEDTRFEESRAAAMVLPGPEGGILAQARSQVDWHRRHRFCSSCGQPSAPAKGGHVRRCPDCGSEHFPRTDPVAIMLIVNEDRCLLGQSAGRLARTGMFSALAGFIDQGESIEEAVRREVREEAGIDVGEVAYHSSQPWPFPSSLMIGCHGRAKSTAIHMDAEEMAAVEWFERDAVAAAMAGDHPTLKLPGPIAIAHHLIQAWLSDTTLLGTRPY